MTSTPPSTPGDDGEGDAVDSALDEAMATMYGVTPTNSFAAATLGLTIRTQVTLEGEIVEALVDTGSPATIVSLKCIIDVLAKKRPPRQSPQQWREAVQKRLQKPSIPLRNYGGGELNLVRELEVKIARAGYSMKSVIQIHVGSSVELLLGTDVLSHLGFSLLAKSTGGTTEDLLMTVVGESPRDGGAIVRLLQTVKLPPRHKKVVHARVDDPDTLSPLLLFEPGDHLLDDERLQAAEAAVTIGDTGQVTLILENHRSEPAMLKEGQILGSVQELSHVIEKSDDVLVAFEISDTNRVNAFLPPPVVESETTPADRHKLISGALDRSQERANLSDDELEQLISLVLEYADLTYH